MNNVKSEHDFLVFTSAGNNSNLKEWVKGKPNFDLWITYYGEKGSLYEEVSPFYCRRSDGKFPNLHDLYTSNPGFLQQYKAIFVMDDDIEISTEEINELFEIQQEYNLWALQPSFDEHGKISHRITRQTPGYYMRYCNFIEMTCPLFRTDKLLDFLDVFDPALKGWGTDYWFMDSMGDDLKYKVAVVDSISCLNPKDCSKPGGGREIDKLQTTDDRKVIWKRIADKYNIPLEGRSKKTFYKMRRKNSVILSFLIWVSTRMNKVRKGE
ncbi:hypothetical protein [Amphritea sp. HPY]|uniref:hypothetical protein n=1 Tax=Amphritea sp. HPY TaxID=3421652 RepID=UPI003D7DED17